MNKENENKPMEFIAEKAEGNSLISIKVIFKVYYKGGPTVPRKIVAMIRSFMVFAKNKTIQQS